MLQRSPDERVWNVMVVDDAHENLRLLATMVSERGWRVRPFADGESALRAAHLDPPDIVLLDVNMPGMGGFEVCRRLKADPRTVEIPVLFVSSLHDTEAKTRAFAVGGVDYITKPFRLEEVDARVRTHVQLTG
jgi:putative two-component system response regulator